MRAKYPIEYELEPVNVDKGTSWLTLVLRNIGAQTLRRLDVHLHSHDTMYLSVSSDGYYVHELRPGQQTKVDMRVTVNGSTEVYATVDGRQDDEHFWWDSGPIEIIVTEDKAKIERLFVLSDPYTILGKALRVEATIKGLRKSEGLKLEFWADTPSGKYEELAKIETKNLSPGEEAQYTAEITPKENGYYRIYASLYDEWRLIDSKTDSLYVRS